MTQNYFKKGVVFRKARLPFLVALCLVCSFQILILQFNRNQKIKLPKYARDRGPRHLRPNGRSRCQNLAPDFPVFLGTFTFPLTDQPLTKFLLKSIVNKGIVESSSWEVLGLCKESQSKQREISGKEKIMTKVTSIVDLDSKATECPKNNTAGLGRKS